MPEPNQPAITPAQIVAVLIAGIPAVAKLLAAFAIITLTQLQQDAVSGVLTWLGLLAGVLIIADTALRSARNHARAKIAAAAPRSVPLMPLVGSSGNATYSMTVGPTDPPDGQEPGDPLHPDFADVPVADPATIPADRGDARSAAAVKARKSKRAKPAIKDGDQLGASASGLSAEHRAKAKSLAIAAARLGLEHAPAIHYSQGASRWDWFKRKMKAYLGQFPTKLDCSAFVTWCEWNGLEHFGVRDTVNGTNWSGGGFTGTMIEHGKTVQHEASIQWGDAAIYGASPSSTEHTAICVGGGMVISHGSEAGPFLLPLHYRPDLLVVKRYV